MESKYSFAERKSFTEYLSPDNQTILGELSTGGSETHTEDYDTDYSCSGYYYTSSIIFSSKLFLFTSVAFVIMGIIGNFINIIVMSQYLRKYSSSVYIFILAISDSAYLISTFLGGLLKPLKCYYFKETRIDFVNHNNFACQLFQYLMDLFSDYSSMIILCFSIERFIAVCKPIKVKVICRIKIVKLLCILLLLVISASVAPHHFMMVGSYYHSCVIDVDSETTYSNVYIIESTIYKIVQVFVIAICNVLIIYQMARKNGIEARERKESSKHVTIILILISASYIILYLPALIHFILWKLVRNHTISISYETFFVTFNCAKLLYICAFSINFYLYSIGSKLFRQQLRETWDIVRRRMSLRVE